MWLIVRHLDYFWEQQSKAHHDKIIASWLKNTEEQTFSGHFQLLDHTEHCFSYGP